MASPSAPRCRELTWSSPEAGNPAFVLREDGKEIGWLRFENGIGARSSGELEGRRWTFERTGEFYPCVTIRAEGSEEPLAEFAPRLDGCSGVVSFASGVRYCWNHAHIWSSSWCFRREGDRSAVCLTQQAGPLKAGAKVAVCCDSLPLPETPVLILFAWYLRVLSFERLSESMVVCG